MRTLIHAYGSAGDVFPAIAVGRALRDRGHDVRMWANEVFRDAVERAGLAWREAGTAEDYATFTEDPRLFHPTRGLKLVLRRGVASSLAQTVESVRSEFVAGDTVVLGTTLSLHMRVVRELEAVPHVTLHMAPAAIPSNHRAPRVGGVYVPRRAPPAVKRWFARRLDRHTDRLVKRRVNDYRATFGLPPVRRVMSGWSHSPDRVLGLFPPWFGPPQPDWPATVRLTGFPFLDSEASYVPPELDAWLDAGEPPVVFTLGAVHAEAATFFRASVDAAAALGRRAVLITSKRETLPAALPGHVFHAPYVPFETLLPRVAALVSHAGVGTCAHALRAGVPHVGVPAAFDQVDNASRLEDLGVGASLPLRRYSARHVAGTVATLLASDRVRDACALGAQRIASDDPLAAACSAVEAMLRDGGAS